jgi:hypothetical protein
MVYSGRGMTDLQTYVSMTDLETYYFYQYEDDGSIYVHTRFIGQSNAVVGIFALDGSFIYGGAATTTH